MDRTAVDSNGQTTKNTSATHIFELCKFRESVGIQLRQRAVMRDYSPGKLCLLLVPFHLCETYKHQSAEIQVWLCLDIGRRVIALWSHAEEDSYCQTL